MKKRTLAETGKKKSCLILEEGPDRVDNKTLSNLQVLVVSSNYIQTKITTSDLFLPLVELVQHALKKPSVAKSILYVFFGGEPDILDDESLKLNQKITTENTKIQDDNKKIKHLDNHELSLLPTDIKKLFEYLGDDTNPNNLNSRLNSFYIQDIFNIESIAILLRALKLKTYTSLELEKDICSNYFNMPEFVELLSKFPNITSLAVTDSSTYYSYNNPFSDDGLNAKIINDLFCFLSKTEINSLTINKISAKDVVVEGLVQKLKDNEKIKTFQLLSLDNISNRGKKLLESVDSFKSGTNRENNAEDILRAIDYTTYQADKNNFYAFKKENIQNLFLYNNSVNFNDPGYDGDSNLGSIDELNKSFFL